MALKSGATQESTPYWKDSLFAWYRSWLENPDETLDDHASGHGWSGAQLYTEMLRLDGHLSFLFRKRAEAVTCLAWQIEPGGPDDRHSEQRDFIQSMFDSLEERASFST